MFSKLGNKKLKSRLLTDVIFVFFLLVSATFILVFTLNRPLSEVYAEGEYSISSAATTNGGFSFSQETALSGGETITVTATPNTGYEVDQMFYMNSSLVQTDITGSSFIMPADNITVFVTFVETDFTLSKGTETNGTFSLLATTANYGNSVTVTTTPDTNYHVSRIYYIEEGDSTEIDVELTFMMPANNITVYVVFTNLYTVTFKNNDSITDYEKVDIVNGETVTTLNMPADLTQEGYLFIGWATTAEATSSDFDADTIITADTDVYPAYLQIITILDGDLTASLEYTGSSLSFVAEDFSATLTGAVITDVASNSNTVRGSYTIALTLTASEGYILNDGTTTSSIITVDGTAEITVSTVILTFSETAYSQLYGSVSAASVTADRTGDFSIVYTYEGREGTSYSSTEIVPTEIGLYNVTTTVSDINGNYTGSATTTFDIKLPANVTFVYFEEETSYLYTYDSVSGAYAYATDPNNSETVYDVLIVYTYVGTGGTVYSSTTMPTDVGTYNVTASINNVTYQGSSITTFEIVEATLDYAVSGYTNSYDGSSHGISLISYTSNVTITYSFDDFVTTETGRPTFIYPNDTNGLGVLASEGITVYYKIEKIGYTTVTGSEIITISPRAIVIKPQDVSITYGDEIPDYSLESINFAPGEDISVLTEDKTLIYSCAYIKGSDAGDYVISINSAYSYSGSNYILSYETGTLTVSKAQITITADDIEIEYDDPIPTYTAQYSGFVNGETEAVLTGTLDFSCSYQQGYFCDDYSITPSGLSSDNYSIQFISGTLTVIKKETLITFSQSTYSQTYGSVSAASATTDPSGINLSYLYEGTGETLYNSATVPTNSGTYNVTVTVDNQNYTGNLTTTFVITKAILTITAVNATIHYLDAIPTYDVSYSGFITGEDSSYLGGSLSVACTYKVGSNIGTYTITPSGLTSDNYDISFVEGVLTVSKLTPVLIAYPTIEEVTYSPTLTLAEVSLTDGVVKSNATENGVVIEGIFIWTDDAISISVSDSGTTSFSITFMPTNTTSCNSISFTRSVIINKATPVVVEPTTNPVPYTPTLTLADVDLNGASADTEGAFDWASSETVLNYTTGTLYEVIFKPIDSVNYNTASMNVTVVVNKATLTTVNAPTTDAIPYTPTLTLNDIYLNGGSASYNETSVMGTFEWVAPTTSISVADSGSSYNVTFTPSSENYNSATTSVAITVNKATATITFGESSYSQIYGLVSAASATTAPVGLTIIYTYTGTGSTTYNSTTVPTNTGTYNVTAEVNDDNYEGSSQVSFIINAAMPIITAPTTNAINYIPDMTLANISLNGGGATYNEATVLGMFAWANTSTSVDVTNSGTSYYVTFTPTDTTNYSTVTGIQVEITISKAIPTVVTPTTNAITYNQSLTLSDISLNGGGASVNSTTVAGIFEWTNPSTVISVTNNETYYSVTFTPSDADNYNSVADIQVQIIVDKATATLVESPTASTVIYTPGLTLSGVDLNGGIASISGTFDWMSPSTELNYTAGTSYAIKFTPTDKDNYNTASMNVTVVVNKATLTTVNAPTTDAIPYTPTLTLNDIYLNGGSASYNETSVTGTFKWVAPTTSVSVADSGTSYSVIFTPESSNYNTVTTEVSITVNKATATVVFDGSYFQTYGSVLGANATTIPADLTLIYTYAGTDSTTYSSSTVPTSVGTYSVTAEVDDDNYEGSSFTSFAITQKALTVTADDLSIYYLDTIPEYTVIYSGFENGDTASALQGVLSFSCEYSPSTAVGPYAIIPGGLSSINYDISFISGTLTVNKIVIDMTGVEIASSKAYTGFAISFTLSDTFRNIPEPSTLTAIEDNSNTDAGLYYVNVTLTADSNYEFDGQAVNKVLTATLYITSQTATVVFPAASAIVYGQTLADSELTGGSVSGGGAFEWQTSSTMPTVAQSGNSFWVVLTPNNVLDYDFSTVVGYNEISGTIVQEVSLTVNSRPLDSDMIQEIPGAMYTGFAITPIITATYNGEILISGDDYSFVYSENVDAGFGVVTATGLGNFTGEATKQFIITPRTIIITTSNRSIIYGNLLPNTTTYVTEIEPVGIFIPVVTIPLLNLSFQYNKASEVVTPKNVGSYTVNITSENPNYVIEYASDIPPTLSIQRRSLTVEWLDLRFIADGHAHKPIAIADTGVADETVGLFVGGSQSSTGTYTATAFISPSNSNYSLVNPTQQFEIVEGEISNDGIESIITIESEYGFSSGTVVLVDEVTSIETEMDSKLVKNIINSYNIKVLLDNSDMVLGEGSVATISMYIGTVDDDFALYVSENGAMVEKEYTLDGGYITFTVSEFGDVSLVKIHNTTIYYIIAAIVIVIAVVITVILVTVSKKKKRGY